MATGRVPTTANSPLTAKGDLFGYSTTQARVAVGNNGETLVADSSATTGLRYSATPSASNPIINSAMQVWQRGTSIACSSSAYGADRWQAYRSVAGATVSRQVTGDTTNLPSIQYCQRVQRDLANSSTTQIFIGQSLETVNSIPMVGKTITISFYARAGANYSSASSALNYRVVYGTGTDQNVITSYTGANNFIDQVATLTSTWQRFSYSASVSTAATELGVYFYNTPVGTAGANDYYEFTGVQIDIGSVALPFRTYAATLQGELAACQRYYATSIPTGFTVADFPVMGTSGAGGQIFTASGTSDLFGSLQYPVPLRTTPTFTAYSGNNRTAGNARDMTTGTDIVFTPAPQAGNNRLLSYVTVGATATSGRPYGFQWTASAEL
jgi:hypothetical protein